MHRASWQARDQGVDQDRGGRDPDEAARRSQLGRVEEAADHEDEEQWLAEHQHRGEDQQPDEEHEHPGPMLAARWG